MMVKRLEKLILQRYYIMTGNDWANAFYLVLLLTFVATSIFSGRKMHFSKIVKYIALWTVIAIFCIMLYSFRFEFEGIKNRFIGALNPSYVQSNNSGQIIISKSQGNHFFANVKINGQNIRFMIDTGASDMSLTLADARKIGINPQELIFNKPYQTANGIIYGATVNLDNIEFGPLNLRNFRASVNKSNMGTSLLGMSFLRKFSRYEVYQGKLILTP